MACDCLHGMQVWGAFLCLMHSKQALNLLTAACRCLQPPTLLTVIRPWSLMLRPQGCRCVGCKNVFLCSSSCRLLRVLLCQPGLLHAALACLPRSVVPRLCVPLVSHRCFVALRQLLLGCLAACSVCCRHNGSNHPCPMVCVAVAA
jgi:hypothetical protein